MSQEVGPRSSTSLQYVQDLAVTMIACRIVGGALSDIAVKVDQMTTTT